MTARVLLLGAALVVAAPAAAPAVGDNPVVSVREAAGTYTVNARFSVPESAAIVRAVLTDYPSIPRFMPDVRTSVVVGRQDGHIQVEQEAVAKFMMFSKRIHLVLDVTEGTDVIQFRDLCNTSFDRYEGAWTIRTEGRRTELTYELAARPAFSVPGFVLRKLLDRDASVMIDRLRAEIAAHAIAQ